MLGRGKLVVILWSSLLLYGCSLSDDEVRNEEASPGGERSAIVFVRNCGATTLFHTQVIVRPRRKERQETEHVVFVARQRQTIELSWSSASELVVNCHSCRDEDIEFQISKVGRLKISYVLSGSKTSL